MGALEAVAGTTATTITVVHEDDLDAHHEFTDMPFTEFVDQNDTALAANRDDTIAALNVLLALDESAHSAAVTAAGGGGGGGGSLRVYNLGTEGDANTEYLELSAEGDRYICQPKRTGTLGSNAFRYLQFTSHNGLNHVGLGNTSIALSVIGNGTSILTASKYYTRFGVDITPLHNDTTDCGTTAYRWANVASVDGDFSGDVIMAANVDFTGLPTADPVVAGRLWNDSGTMKISAG